MWQRVFLVVIILGLSGQLSAQHNLYVGLRGGFQASTANLSHTIFGTTIPTSQVYGLSTGIIIKYFPKPQLGLQWEINYSQKGFEQVLTDTNEVFETSFDYLEIPFMFNVYLGKRKTQYFANLGPYFAILVSEETTGPQGSTSEILDYLYDPDRDNKTSFGLKVAAGIYREFPFGGLQVDGYLTADVSNFLEPVDLSTGVPDNSQNFAFGVSVAYLLPLGSRFEEED